MNDFLMIAILASGLTIEAPVSRDYCRQWMENTRTGRIPSIERDGVDVPVLHATCGPRYLVKQPPRLAKELPR